MKVSRNPPNGGFSTLWGGRMALFYGKSDWRDRLRDASFRGVSFSVEDEEGTFGRRVQVHEYPGRDKPFTEDLGRATRRLSINAYISGDDYSDKRNRLIAAIETPGPGTLIHPNYGEMQGSIDGQVRVTHSTAEGRMCRITFHFVESGELSFPTAGSATGKRLSDSTGLFDGAIESAFEAFSLSGISDFIQSDVLADGASMLKQASDAFSMVNDGVSAAMRLLQGDLSVILMPPSSANDFVRALQKAWRAGSRTTDSTNELIKSIKRLSGFTLDSGLAPRGTWATDSVSVATQKTQSNLISSVIRTTAISEAVRSVTFLPQPRISASQSRQNSVMSSAKSNELNAGGSGIINVAHPALDSIAADEAEAVPATWDDLTEIRTLLNGAIDSEQMRISDDVLFMAISTLRADFNRDISQRLAQVEHTANRQPEDVFPALVLAAQWYDDASREGDILSRNMVRHPGFVPVRPLRVPVR